MHGLSKWLVVLALQVFACAVAGAQEVRDRALHDLASSDVDLRRAAVMHLAEVGRMQDSDALIEALRDDDRDVRGLAEQALWQVWMRSGDPDVDALLRTGMRALEEGRMGQAIDAFTRVIEKQPDFAEGWNKRATTYFLIGDQEQALKDCDETLKRNPNHFGALSGCGVIYAQRNQLDEALDFFERALAINPNMPGVERGLELVRQRLGSKGRRAI